MAKIAKITVLIVLAIVILLAIAAFIITRILDPNDYKDEIQTLAREKANIILQLDGDIGWSFFPWVGLELHQASVASVETPDKPLAEVSTIGLAVRALPLLRKEIQMREIIVDGLKFTPERDADGKTNWSGIGETPKSLSANNDTPEQSDARSPLKIDIDRIHIRNASLRYQDAQADTDITIDPLNMMVSALGAGKESPLTLNVRFDNGKKGVNGNLSLEARMKLDPEAQQYALDALSMRGEVSGDALGNKTLPFSAAGNIAIDQAAQMLTWAPLNIGLDALKAEGDFTLQNWSSAPAYQARLAIAQTDLRKLSDKLGVDLPPMANASALTKFSFSTDVSGTAGNIRMDNLSITLDETTITGSAAVGLGEKITLASQLAGDKINIDHYLPKEKTKAASTSNDKPAEAPAASTAVVWSDDPALPLDALRGIDFSLDIRFDQIVARNAPLNNFLLKADNKNGLVSLRELSARLFNGTFSTEATLDARNNIPRINAHPVIENVQIDQVFAALQDDNNKAAPINGKLQANANIEAIGNSLKAWTDSLSGNVALTVSDGVLPGADFEMKLCAAIALLNKKMLSKEYPEHDTPFRQIKGTLQIENGLAHNPDLSIALPGLSVKGRGDIDIKNLSMDYRIGIIIEGDQTAMPDPACTVNKRYVGLEWPLRCRGPLASGAKMCGIDQEGIAQIALKLAGDKLTDKAMDKIDDKLGDKAPQELKDALKGLFR